MASKTVGMIGLGIMGSAMSSNLIKAGFQVVGFDVVERCRRDHKKAGGTIASHCSAVARNCSAIVTSLPSVEALLETAVALAKSSRRPAIVIETSTLPIPVKEDARQILAAREITLLDCPLSGTGAQARAKDLIVYASGDPVGYHSAAPILEGFARAHYYVGEFGAGSKMKFVANLLVAIHNIAAAEAMVLAMKSGLDPEAVIEVIAPGAGGSRMFEMRAPMMARDRYEPATMRVSTWSKDMSIIAAFARELGVETPCFDATRPIYEEALRLGLGEMDTAAVCRVIEDKSHVTRPPVNAAPG
jgi:3-hydroxyisobutyrate dehydrogenase-like beta-hydroxyacid dehydrogenase